MSDVIAEEGSEWYRFVLLLHGHTAGVGVRYLNTCHVAAGLLQNDVRTQDVSAVEKKRKRGKRKYV